MPVPHTAVSLLVPIATTAGENLEDSRGLASPVLHDHTSAGDVVIVGTGCLFGAAALLYLVGLRPVTDRLGLSPAAVRMIDAAAKVLAVVAAIAAVWLVYRAGDTGARAVWG